MKTLNEYKSDFEWINHLSDEDRIRWYHQAKKSLNDFKRHGLNTDELEKNLAEFAGRMGEKL